MRIASLGKTEPNKDQTDQVRPKNTRKRRHSLRSSPPFHSSTSTTQRSPSNTSSSSGDLQNESFFPLIDYTEIVVSRSSPMRGAGRNTASAFSSSTTTTSITTSRSSPTSTNLNYRGSPLGLSSRQNSPVDRTNSPGYDFRDTTARRRSYLESTESSGQPMQYNPLACIQESQSIERSGRKSESPNRKRRRMSQGAVDLSQSPSPPSLVRPWQTTSSMGSGQWPAVNQHIGYQGGQRYGDWCTSSSWRTPGRRSPPSMRRQSQRQRERQLRSQNIQQQQQQQQQQHQQQQQQQQHQHQQQQQHAAVSGNDRRAFHPPNLQTHHTVLPPPPSHVPFQPHIIIDLSSDVRAHVPISSQSAPISIPVSVPSYAVPMCTAHTIPTCSFHHGPYAPIPVTAGGRPTYTATAATPIPICSMGHIPMCGVHIPGCSGHHLPVSPQTSMPHMLPQESLMTHVHTHHHVPPQVQYFAAPPPTQTRSSEVEIIGERPAAFHVPSSTQHNPSLTPSPPLHLLQESILRTPQEVHHMHAYPRLNTISRQQQQQQQQRRPTATRPWRNQVSPSVPVQPSYPGWFLRFLFPSPPVNQMELENEDAEVENYEALLNLAERLGEAKPRGLTKAYIDQLPSYLYKPDTHQSINDQTCCVVCMCDFEARQLLRVLPCSHEFHARCVDKWLKTNRTCPICRADASEMNNQSD